MSSIISYLSQGGVTSPPPPSPPVRAIVHNVIMVATETAAKTKDTIHSLLTRQHFPMASLKKNKKTTHLTADRSSTDGSQTEREVHLLLSVRSHAE